MAFAREGARILVSGRRDDVGLAFAKELRELGAEAAFVAPTCAMKTTCEPFSTFGSRGAAGASMYVASKHAVEGLTKAAALEGAAARVRVNAVAPGPVETELLNRFAGGADKKAALAAGVPARRLGTPEDIAATIVFLASDRADFITGHIIGVNGGKTAL